MRAVNQFYTKQLFEFIQSSVLRVIDHTYILIINSDESKMSFMRYDAIIYSINDVTIYSLRDFCNNNVCNIITNFQKMLTFLFIKRHNILLSSMWSCILDIQVVDIIQIRKTVLKCTMSTE